MLILKYIAKLLKILSKEATPQQIAGGFIIGAAIGLIPKFNLTAFILLCLLLFIRVNISMGILGIAIFSIIGLMTDLFTEPLGFFMLTGIPPLNWLWTFMYNLPLLPWTGFNNTLVMGNIIFSLVIAYPLYLGTCKFVVYFRENLMEKVVKWKVVQLLKATKLFSLYQKFS